MTTAHPPDTTAPPLPGLWAWMSAVGGSLGLLLLLAALLVSLRLEKALTDLVEARATLVARQLADAVEGGLRFGVPLADQTEIPRRMAALSQSDPSLLHLALVDEQGRPVHPPGAATGTATPARPPANLDASTVQRLLARKAVASPAAGEPARKVWLEGATIQVLMQVRDATGFASGAVWVVVAATEPQSAFAHSLQRLSLWAIALAAGVTVLLGALWAVLSRQTGARLAALANPPAPSGPPAAPGAAWPLLPVPQALRTLARLEAELTELVARPIPAAQPTTQERANVHPTAGDRRA